MFGDNVSLADNPPNKMYTVYLLQTLHGLQCSRAIKVQAYTVAHARKLVAGELPAATIVKVERIGDE